MFRHCRMVWWRQNCVEMWALYHPGGVQRVLQGQPQPERRERCPMLQVPSTSVGRYLFDFLRWSAKVHLDPQQWIEQWVLESEFVFPHAHIPDWQPDQPSRNVACIQLLSRSSLRGTTENALNYGGGRTSSTGSWKASGVAVRTSSIFLRG